MSAISSDDYRTGKGLIILLSYQIFRKTSNGHSNKEEMDEEIRLGRYRYGAVHDVSSVTKVADRLDCDFIHKADLTKVQTFNFIQELTNMKKSYGYIIMIISSHGYHGDIILSSDCKEMRLYDDIISHLNNRRCPIFAGIPKIFIANACRGEEVVLLKEAARKDGREDIELYTNTADYRIDTGPMFLSGDPAAAINLHPPVGDIYKIFSTTPESVSIRYADKGSPLLTTLFETLEDLMGSEKIKFLEWVKNISTKMQDDYGIVIETHDILDKRKEKTFYLATNGKYSH